MSQEIEFAQSEIAEIISNSKELIIHFRLVTIVASGSIAPSETARSYQVPASVTIDQPRYKTLPKKGVLADGELYGVPGKPLNGRLPIDYRCARSIELVLVDQSVEHSIHGKGIVVKVEKPGLT